MWLSLWTAEIDLSVKEGKDSPQLLAGLAPSICSAGKKRALERQYCHNGVHAGGQAT